MPALCLYFIALDRFEIPWQLSGYFVSNARVRIDSSASTLLSLLNSRKKVWTKTVAINDFNR